MIMAVTFDTNALLSATLWDGSVAQKLLFDLIRQNVKIYSSADIINEYKRVLKRDFEFPDEDVAEAVKKVLSFVTLANPKIKLDAVKDDPDDNSIVECALESRSKYIITYDLQLLKLKEYKGVQIIRPEIARAIF